MAGSKTGAEDAKMPKVNQSNKILPWAVFVPTLVIVLISITSIVFPAFIVRTTSPFHSDVLETEVIDPFTPGFLAVALVTINILVLGIGIAHYKGTKVRKFVKKIVSFEITKKQSVIAIIVILAVFSTVTAGTLAKEETWEDYPVVKKRVDAWNISQFTKSFEPHIRYLLLSSSLLVFGNIRVVPFITSIALLLLVYFFTANITQKKFAGIISMIVLLQSQVFVSYSTTASYDNSWIILYLFSLYLIQRFWQSSTVPYFISIFSKALTVAFLPMSLYFIARSSLPKRSKIYSLASYGVIIMVLAVAAFVIFKKVLPAGDIGFNDVAFWQGFSSMAMQMRFDYVILIFLLPLTVMLFFASRRGILHADSMMIMILGMLLTSPFLVAITNQTNQPYRFVSLSVFFAVGIGVLLSNRIRKQDEVWSNR